MRWRRLIALLTCVLLASTVHASAQTSVHARRIGVLSNAPEDEPEIAKRLAVFRTRLAELGWIEGKNLQIDVRFGRNDGERIRRAAMELMESAPDVTISTTSTTTRALMNATKNVPILAAVSGDPVALGFTKDFSHPTGNITGFTTFNDTLAAKRLEMLREVAPAMETIALMWVPINPQQVLLETQTKEAARAVGIKVLSMPIKSASDIAPALASAHDQNASAIIVGADPLTGANIREIVERCLSLNLPAIHTFPYEARNGALMSYGIDIEDNYRRTAEYADRVLKGTKIADLPFQDPTRLTLAINLRTARALGIKVPTTLLATADEVIE